MKYNDNNDKNNDIINNNDDDNSRERLYLSQYMFKVLLRGGAIILTYETFRNIPVGIYLFKVNNGNTRTLCEICSRLTTKITKRRH